MKRRLHCILYHLDPRTTSGDSLLHLSVSKNNTLKTQNLFDDGHYAFFPNFDVARLLIDCGAKINALNEENSTPLHVASAQQNFKMEVRKYAIFV